MDLSLALTSGRVLKYIPDMILCVLFFTVIYSCVFHVAAFYRCVFHYSFLRMCISCFTAFYGCVFLRRKEPAFSNYHLWEAVGFVVAFAYSGFLCTYIKICVLLGMLCLGMMGYFIVECRRRCDQEDAEIEARERERKTHMRY